MNASAETSSPLGDFCQLDLEISDVRFEDVALPYLDSEKMVVVLVSLSARCALDEEHFGHFFEVMERMWRQGAELI